jgi:hypothetical protein
MKNKIIIVIIIIVISSIISYSTIFLVSIPEKLGSFNFDHINPETPLGAQTARLTYIRNLNNFVLCLFVFATQKSVGRCLIFGCIFHFLFWRIIYMLDYFTYINNVQYAKHDLFRSFRFFIDYFIDYYFWLFLSYIYSICICKAITNRSKSSNIL